MKRGDFVDVTMGGRTVAAMVMLASPNDRSLMLGFDGMLGGYVGAMPVLDKHGTGDYVELFTGRPVKIAPKQDTK